MADARHHRTYTLGANGDDLRVETWSLGSEKNHARLLVNGDEVDRGRCGTLEHVDLAEDTPHHTRVSFLWTGKVGKVALVLPGEGEVKRRSIPYAPPEGTRARRTYDWGLAHPNLYAARHVVGNLAGTAAAVLGVAALIKLVIEPLIPDVDGPDLPDIDWPDWLKYLDPFRYLKPVFEFIGDILDALLGWIPPLFEWVPDGVGPYVKYFIGFCFAVAVAVREAKRRKRIVDGAGEPRDGGDAGERRDGGDAADDEPDVYDQDRDGRDAA